MTNNSKKRGIIVPDEEVGTKLDKTKLENLGCLDKKSILKA